MGTTRDVSGLPRLVAFVLFPDPTRAHFAHRGTSRLNCKRMSPDPAGFRSLGAIRRLRATKDKIANRVLTITAPGTLDNDRSGIW